MAQEKNEHEATRVIAVQSLKNELELAVTLLREIKKAREPIAEENYAVDSARSAFRHAVDALNRMPQLDPKDMDDVQRLLDEFRSALSDLDQ